MNGDRLMLQSPDGDLIDCVPLHLQPAFDHPMLKGHKPLVGKYILASSFYDNAIMVSKLTRSVLLLILGCLKRAPKRPKGSNSAGVIGETFQAWAASGETCPDGTIPIRRTKEEDLLRASCIKKYGRKPAVRLMRRDITGINSHEVSNYKYGKYD